MSGREIERKLARLYSKRARIDAQIGRMQRKLQRKKVKNGFAHHHRIG